MNIPFRLVSRRVILPCLGLAACALATARPAHAQTDFTFTVSNPNTVAPPGSTVTLNGTLTFTGPTLHPGFGFGGYDTSLVSLRTDPAFTAFFGTAATTYTGALLDVTFFASDTPGAVASEPGTVFFVRNDSGQISQPVSLTVGPAAVPEPSPVAVFGLGGLCLGGLVVAVRRRRAPSSL